MKTTDHTLMEQLRINNRAIERRKEYLDFTQQDVERLESLRQVVSENIEEIVENFYIKILPFDEMDRVIGDAETLARLKNHQHHYILTLFDGQYDEEYVHSRLRVGLVHKRIGLNPTYYVAAIHNLSSILRELITEKSNQDCNSCMLNLSAIEKILMFDLSLTFDTYINSLMNEAQQNRQELELGGVRKKVAILFADIRNFTSFSEDMDPEVLVKFLNEYFTHMVDIIFKYGGTVDKFAGDEIMAIFGAPISEPDDEIRAVKAAIEMQKKMEWLQYYWQEWNLQRGVFYIGIGINSGEVIAGNIGSKKHMDYTVIGDVVNTAKRLESEAGGGKILVSRNIRESAGDKYKFKDVGKIFVKGKKKPVETFEVIN